MLTGEFHERCPGTEDRRHGGMLACARAPPRLLTTPCSRIEKLEMGSCCADVQLYRYGADSIASEGR